MQRAMFGMGCFWGAEKGFWSETASTARRSDMPRPDTNPTTVRSASGLTVTRRSCAWCSTRGHSYDRLLAIFWEGHDPTQGMRQGADVGTQYRSAVYTEDDAQASAVAASLPSYQKALSDAGHGQITTEIGPAPEFFYAEDYHQQYLAKNPDGYCGHGGTGVSCPIGALGTVGTIGLGKKNS